MEYGFVRVAAAVPTLQVADCGYNAENIIKLIKKAALQKVQIVVFPELSVTGYSCGDLFMQKILLDSSVSKLEDILDKTKSLDIVAIVGLPLALDNQLFNCAVVIKSGEVLGTVPKSFIPGYVEFYEERWFSPEMKKMSDTVELFGKQVPFGADILFREKNSGLCFGTELCEDLWVPVPPSSLQAVAGAEIIFNLSASDEVIGKYEYRRDLVKQQSGRCISGYVYTSSGINESTTDLVFGGHAIISEYGSILAESERFVDEEQLIITEIDVEKIRSDRRKTTSFMELPQKMKFRTVEFNQKEEKITPLIRNIDPHPFVPGNPKSRDKRCEEIFAIQTSGLYKRLKHTKMKHVVIGVSGGLDSTLALLVAVRAFKKAGISEKNITAITMPGFGTTDGTNANAIQLVKSVGATLREIDIKPASLLHFKDIGHDEKLFDVTYENVQARERTQILMDIANKQNGLVIGTGDLSELALGWSTYNGDHMSMYAVNCGVPKTLVKYLVQWVADNVVDPGTKNVLHKIIDTPISPELLPPDAKGKINQKTEDIIGPYELHDFFLYHVVRYGAQPKKVLFLANIAYEKTYSDETIRKYLKVFYTRFFSQQFKRSCLPDGPKVGTISLSPRGDWRMPSDAQASVWLADLEGNEVD
jgi:NAD+ synthase (glutamine-hydrolysing)